MSRQLHEQDVCEISTRDLEAELQSLSSGDVLVLAVEDDRLQPLIPIDGQETLFGDTLDFGPKATLYTAPLPTSASEQPVHFPNSNDERFHFGTNSFETVIMLIPKCGYFQRGPPFLDATRIVSPGGSLISVSGLQPTADVDHAAKWWVPASDDAELDVIRLLRTEDYKTPVILSKFTVTSDSPRYPEATVVTEPR